MRHLLRTAAAFLLLLPSPAAAQFDFITALFKDVHSITIYGQATHLTSSSQIRGAQDCIAGGALCGAGAEVLIDLTAPEDLHVELGLGTSFQRGFASENNALDFRGAVRAFPTFGAYVTGPNVLGGVLEPYIGANFGYSELWNVQVYDSARLEHSVKGSTFDWGGTLGLYFNFPTFDGLFVEVSRRSRRFSSLDYTLAGGASVALPQDWPRELDLSGWQYAVGWQFDLKRKPKAAAFYPGVWYLSRVDALTLPALVAQSVGSGTPPTSVRTELLSGMLHLTPTSDTTGTYRMELTHRKSTITAAGVMIAADPLQMEPEGGTYRTRGQALTLDPSAEGDADAPYNVVRLDDEIRFISRKTGHGLVFKKVKTGG